MIYRQSHQNIFLFQAVSLVQCALEQYAGQV